jgi:hypothetical protein
MRQQQMFELCKVGEVVEIPNTLGKHKRLPDDIRYDYEKDPCKCPVPDCSGLGVPWGGWFECEDCHSKFWIETGEGFSPL